MKLSGFSTFYFLVTCSITTSTYSQTLNYSIQSGGIGIFIIAGQSNASGRGELNSSTETPNPRILMFGNDYQWKTAYEPTDDPLNQVDGISNDSAVISSTKGHSFGLKASKDLVTTGLDSVILIPCPKGGTTISEWRKPIDPFDRTTLFGSCNYRRVTAAPNGITALWWYQGESNAGSANFINDNTSLMNEFRSEMGANLPIIYVQLAKNMDSTTNSAQHKTAEDQRRMESNSGYASALSNHFMVVTFDLPLTDAVHINQTAQKELGRRIALSTREHIYGEPVNGTGPRLATSYPLTYLNGDGTKIKVKFNKTINASINQYDNQFRVFDNSSAMTILNVVRDSTDDTSVIITISTTAMGIASVSYGDVVASSTGIWYTHVVQDSDGLPTPQFGPLYVYGTFSAQTDGIVDNMDPGFNVLSGTWGTSTITGGYASNYFFHSTGTGANVVQWTFNITTSGNYQIFLWYLESSNRAIDSPVTIFSDNGSTTLRINQTINGKQWFSLGVYPFTSGTGFVEMSDDAEAGKFVIADAVRYTYMSPLTILSDWFLY